MGRQAQLIFASCFCSPSSLDGFEFSATNTPVLQQYNPPPPPSALRILVGACSNNTRTLFIVYISCCLRHLVKFDASYFAPDDSSVSVSWLVVTDAFSLCIALQSSLPDVVGWVGWVHNPWSTGKELTDISLFVESSPAYAACVQHNSKSLQSAIFDSLYIITILHESLDFSCYTEVVRGNKMAE